MMDMVLTGLTCHQPCRNIHSTVEISLCSPTGPHRLHHCSQSTGYVLLRDTLFCWLQVSSLS